MSRGDRSRLDFNAFDRDVIGDPYPYYRQLRDDEPAHWSPTMRSWVLSRHSDIREALSSPGLFSSARGIFPSPNGPSMADAFLPMLIMTDPPRHTWLRQAISSAFTRRSVGALEQTVADIVRRLTESLPARGATFDFVDAFAGPLPALVIADMLGIPGSDLDMFRAWSTQLVQANSHTREGLEAAANLYQYFASHVEDRRAHPGEDLISSLVLAEHDGERLSDAEVLGTCLLLLVAGHETTTNLLSNSMVVLNEEVMLREALRDDPGLIPRAIEEMLRYESPVQGLSRTLTHDVELHGKHLKAGESVLLLFGSANRDERVFDQPDRFNLERGADRHLAFGRGTHFCLGAPLARVEARFALESILQALGTWTIDLDSSSRLASAPIRGFSRLVLERA